MTEPTKTFQDLVARGLLDSLADGLLVCDAEGTILAVNGRLEELTGFSTSELTGAHLKTLVPEGVRERHEQLRIGYGLAGHPTRTMGVDLDLQLRTRSGVAMPVDIALSALHVEEETLVVASIRDAIPRLRQEQYVWAMRSVMEAILKGIPTTDIYSLVCEQAVELTGASLALVALRTVDSSGYRVTAASDTTGNGEALLGEVLPGYIWDDAVKTDHRTELESPELPAAPGSRSLGPTRAGGSATDHEFDVTGVMPELEPILVVGREGSVRFFGASQRRVERPRLRAWSFYYCNGDLLFVPMTQATRTARSQRSGHGR